MYPDPPMSGSVTYSPDAETKVTVVCDTCPRSITADTIEELALLAHEQGWTIAPITGDRDVCGFCR